MEYKENDLVYLKSKEEIPNIENDINYLDLKSRSGFDDGVFGKPYKFIRYGKVLKFIKAVGLKCDTGRGWWYFPEEWTMTYNEAIKNKLNDFIND